MKYDSNSGGCAPSNDGCAPSNGDCAASIGDCASSISGCAGSTDGTPVVGNRDRDKVDGIVGALAVRGKFLYRAEEKMYLKSVWIRERGKFPSEIQDLSVNTVWLSNPTPYFMDFFHKMGIAVVACLDLKDCLLAKFNEQTGAEKNWHEYLGRLIPEISSHPALLAYELEASVSVTMLKDMGKSAIERFIHKAFQQVKSLDAVHPITCTNDVLFANLDLRFLDFFSFKLSTQSLTDIRIQLARLQTQCADKPLVVHLPNIDSAQNGADEQAFAMDQQIRMSFIAGCAGVSLNAEDLFDTAHSGKTLGLVDAKGRKKPAFDAVRGAFEECPFPAYLPYPKMSVVICVYNGEDYIEECLDGCNRLDYPNFEVIVVNDGSTDRTLELAESRAKQYGFTVVGQIPNAGLSAARNLGMRTATGEIIAYLDSDAFPDEYWLRYLAVTFLSYKYAIVGGPNINPLSTDAVADCIDKAPGNSQVVMLDDETADHIPGCNLAVRREFMQTIGGFDESYRGGGDDVTFCWRVMKAGGTLGVSPGAMVWHYRRPTVSAYFKQQRGYGKGEAVLERDYPERFNSLGHQVSASSKMGSQNDSMLTPLSVSPIYQALRGGESILQLGLSVFPTMPEWPMILSIFALLSACGALWQPFLLFLPILLIGIILWLAAPIRAGLKANLRFPSCKTRLLLIFLHLAQPLVRLQGRLSSGMTPWRSRCKNGFVLPRRSIVRLDTRNGSNSNQSLKALQNKIRETRLPAVQGSAKCNWDWQIEGGIFGGIRVLSNASDSELVLKIRPYAGSMTFSLLFISTLALALSLACHAWTALILVSLFAASIISQTIRQSGEALAALQPILTAEHFASGGLWQLFQPPRHFFESSVTPGQCALAFARGIVHSNELSAAAQSSFQNRFPASDLLIPEPIHSVHARDDRASHF